MCTMFFLYHNMQKINKTALKYVIFCVSVCSRRGRPKLVWKDCVKWRVLSYFGFIVNIGSENLTHVTTGYAQCPHRVL